MAGTAAAPQLEKDFYRIGEVSRMTGLKPFVLRYWETEFPMLEPVKSASGHRLYRSEDVDMVLRIKRLLYDEGYTIAGARRHLRDPNALLESQHGGEYAFGNAEARARDEEARGEEMRGGDGHAGEARGENRGSEGRSGEGRGGEMRGENSGGYRGELPAPLLNRKMLLDLRDSLRAFLTLLERR